MANYYRNEEIIDYFTILDLNSVPITGATIAADILQDPDGMPYSVVLAEVGNGTYSVTFTPTKAGIYYYRIVCTSTVPNQYFEQEFDIELGPTGNLTYDNIGSAEGTTLYELIRMTATRLGDFRQLIATQASSTETSFTDELRLSAIPSSTFKGANLWISSPITSPNFWAESRIRESSEDTKQLTLAVPLPEPPATNDIAWVTNLNSKGHWRQDYVDAINGVILSSHPRHLEPITFTFDPVWNVSQPRAEIPAAITHIYSIEYEDGYGWHELPMSPQNNMNFSGWSLDLTTKELLLSGGIAAMANGYSVRLRGYGRSGVLSDPSDMTSLNAGWLHLKAASNLLQGKGDQKLLAQASMLANESSELDVAMITQVQPNTIRIR